MLDHVNPQVVEPGERQRAGVETPARGRSGETRVQNRDVEAWMLVVWHLGALHPVEKTLTLLLAFGPFVVLGLVLYLRRDDDSQEREEADRTDQSDQPAR